MTPAEARAVLAMAALIGVLWAALWLFSRVSIGG